MKEISFVMLFFVRGGYYAQSYFSQSNGGMEKF